MYYSSKVPDIYVPILGVYAVDLRGQTSLKEKNEKRRVWGEGGGLCLCREVRNGSLLRRRRLPPPPHSEIFDPTHNTKCI